MCAAQPGFTQSGATEGLRIVDVIAELREQGVTVIYSSELITPDMRVRAPPSSADAVARLREILEPYGLMLDSGPQDSWLVVADPDYVAPEPSPVPPPARPSIAAVPLGIEEVVVSASRYAFSRGATSSVAQIDRLQLENTPTLGEDAVRATHVLPGITSSGLSATFNVRGGATDEALLFLDGVELIEPFHLKDFQNLFSSVNPSIIDSMTVFTGAFPAQYGNRMSAVVDMRTVEPANDRVFELGASLFTTSALAAGQFAEGRGHWLASARRGNLDLLIDATDSDIGNPEYQDLFAKLSYDVGQQWTIGLGVLGIDDEIALRESSSGEAHADYDDSYLWLRADYAGSDVDAALLFSVADLATDRFGGIDEPGHSVGSLVDAHEYELETLRGDWSFSRNERHLLSWGLELRRASARYAYAAQRADYVSVVPPPPLQTSPANVAANLAFDGDSTAVYGSYRFRPLQRVTAELGLRWDEQDYLDDSQLSPRFNVLFELSPRMRLRGSWGRYFQTQRLDEIQVSDGLFDLFPAQDSEHYVLGLEYVFADGTAVRLEAYRKEIERLQPRHENLFARVGLLPELQPDRVTIAPERAESTGLELSADGEHGRWRWWASLTRARSYDVFAASRAPRSWEEPMSVKGGAIRSGLRWDLAVTTSWHSGWPISALTLANGQLLAGPYNAQRFGRFGSVDLRLSRDIELEHGALEFYFSVINVFARENPCCVEYDLTLDAAGQPIDMTLGTDNWLSIVPNLGIVWRFSGSAR